MEKKKRKKKLKESGRPTELTDELFAKIKQSILDGNDLGKTAEVCKISKSTFYTWSSDNYLKLADKIENWKRDRKLNLAEGVIEEMLVMPVTVLRHVESGDEELDYIATEPALVRIKQDTAKFVAETLGKDNYSKRSEMTGKNGSDLIPKPLLGGASNVKPDVSNNNGDNKTTDPDQKD